MHALAVAAVNTVVLAKDKPVDEDTNIVAGPVAFWIFLGLAIAVVVIGFALTRSLRTADRARRSGVYGDPVETDDSTGSTEETQDNK